MRPHSVGYEHRTITKVPDWHGLVAWDLLLNNLTTGLFVVMALAELAAPAVFGDLARVAYPAALVFLIADLTCLTLDLGDPWRFHHMLRVFKPSSPMSLGTWCLTVYSLPATVAAALSSLPADETLLGIRRIVVVLGLAPAFGAAIYKGVLLSTNAQPGWKDARWLGGYLANSALLLGCAELALLSIVLGAEPAVALLRLPFAVLLALNFLPLSLLVADLRPTLVRRFDRRQLALLATFGIALGLLLPLALVLASPHAAATVAAALLLTMGMLVLRFALLRIPSHPGAAHAGSVLAEPSGAGIVQK